MSRRDQAAHAYVAKPRAPVGAQAVNGGLPGHLAPAVVLLSHCMLTESESDCLLVLEADALPEATQKDLDALRWRYDQVRRRALIGGPAGPVVSVPIHSSRLAGNPVESESSRPLLLQLGFGLPSPIEVRVAEAGWGRQIDPLPVSAVFGTD